MATNPSTLPENAGRLTAPDANYPYGSAKNDSTGTTGDGTPIRAPLMNDTYGFYQALLTRAGIVPSGVAETALNSQLLDAIDAIIAASASDTLNTTRINVASASSVNLTTAAPDTRHINITGTTTINGFVVEEGKCYFVRFAGALTLTNSGSLVTQYGANITTVAGDTCIIRATADNVVEILCYTSPIRVVDQTFTVSGIFTAPWAGDYYLDGCGGGADGGVGSTSGGGGSGAWCKGYKVTLSAGQSVTVTVGGVGGTTSFGSILTMTGGTAGSTTDGGVGGTVTVGAGPGAFNGVKGGFRAAASIGGAGAPSVYGLAGSQNNGTDTVPAIATGFGAGGAGKNSATYLGTGTPGFIRVRGQR